MASAAFASYLTGDESAELKMALKRDLASPELVAAATAHPLEADEAARQSRHGWDVWGNEVDCG